MRGAWAELAVTVIELDASDWKTTSDFYDALLSALSRFE